jgi:hypothetical protein
VERDFVAVPAKRLRRRIGDGVVETSGIGMSEDNGYVHIVFP